MRPLIRAGAVIAASALLPLSLVIAPHAAQAAGACTPATNIEAIVDDSGSMDFSDPDVNRGHAVELLFAQSTLQGKTPGRDRVRQWQQLRPRARRHEPRRRLHRAI